MPFVDLKAQYERLASAIDARIQGVLEHGRYILGPEVAELEEELAGYVGARHAVGCSSGTDGLLLALMALGVGPGDAVFTTPFTFVATAEVIRLLGATPVFVDIDRATYNLDPARLELAVRALEAGDPGLHPLPAGHRELTARGVIGVDLYGLPADYDALSAVCGAHHLFLVEDAAQSFGAEYRGRRACSLGDVGVTSFFPAKPLGCYGDGGMAFTDRDDLAAALRSLLVHGKGSDKYDNVRVGLNARLDTLQAAILLAKWEAFPAELEARQLRAQDYREALSPLPAGLSDCPAVPGDTRSAWAQYTVRCRRGQRESLQQRLRKRGVPSAVYYPLPLSLQGAFRDLGYAPGGFPVAEEASCEVLSLPFGPYLGREEIAAVAAALAQGG
jgi:dTDP-4-amino-4,6-dideoxygalactose transaminase